MADLVSGRYRDVLTADDGTPWRATAWRANRVMDGAYRLIATLLRGDPPFTGIRFWAFGSGLDTWDAAIPRPLPNESRLTTEIVRIGLGTGDIAYLDGNGQPAAAPTRRLRVRATLVAADFITTGFQSLREFALFGGDADVTANSGIMINRVIHPRIDLAAGDTLTRTLELTFGGAAGEAEEVATGGFAQNLPVEAMQGVGSTYSAALRQDGLFTFSDLASMDPLHPVPDIPPARVREMRAKSRAVANIGLEPDLITVFAGRRAADMLEVSPQSLAQELATILDSSAARELSRAIAFQEALAPVQFGVDETLLRAATLQELMAGAIRVPETEAGTEG